VKFRYDAEHSSHFVSSKSLRYNPCPGDVKAESWMIDNKDDRRWIELCERAAKEQDPKRLLELVAEILRLRDGKEQRLKA
jgi:hypothetical protein